MRKFVMTLALLLVAGMLVNNFVYSMEDGSKTKITMIKVKPKLKPIRDRSLGPAVEAWYSPETATVDLTCYGAGETSIYIVDTYGEAVVSDAYDFTISPCCTVDAPMEKGSYLLVLDSEEFYAEGEFEVE